jgi:hypothetical protein
VKPGNDPKWISYGPWVGVAGTSTVTCGNRPPAGDYELR